MKRREIHAIESGLRLHHFQDQGFSCKVVPAFGGSIQELILNEVPIIRGSQPDQEQGREDYLHFCRSGLLFPFPNRIRDGNYRFGGRPYQLPLNDTDFGHAIHGLVYTREFEVREAWDSGLHMLWSQKGVNGYPFPFEVELMYHFTSTGLKMEVIATNVGNNPMPIGIGWHPYFWLYEENQLKMEADTRYACDKRMIPTQPEQVHIQGLNPGSTVLDEAYRLTSRRVALDCSAYSIEMELPQDSYLQLFTPEDGKTVAIEPMSCIANSFNNGIGLQTLEPGASYNWRVVLHFHSK